MAVLTLFAFGLGTVAFLAIGSSFFSTFLTANCLVSQAFGFGSGTEAFSAWILAGGFTEDFLGSLIFGCTTGASSISISMSKIAPKSAAAICAVFALVRVLIEVRPEKQPYRFEERDPLPVNLPFDPLPVLQSGFELFKINLNPKRISTPVDSSNRATSSSLRVSPSRVTPSEKSSIASTPKLD